MPPVREYEAEDVLVVSAPEQLRAFAATPRVAIVGALREGARSISELSAELGIPKGTVGHHMKVLEDAGLVRVVGTRRVRALTEKYYGRVARLFVFQGEEAPEAVPPVAAATLRRAADEIERTSKGTNMAFVRAALSQSDATRFNRRLKRLVEDFRTTDAAGGKAYGLAVAMWTKEPGDA